MCRLQLFGKCRSHDKTKATLAGFKKGEKGILAQYPALPIRAEVVAPL
jgi:hypothetical protein